MKDIRHYIELQKKIKSRGHSDNINYDSYDLDMLERCMYKFQSEYNHPEYFIPIFEDHGIFSVARKISSFISKFIINYCIEDGEDHNIMFICNEIPELTNNYFNIIYINFDSSENNGEYDISNESDKFIDDKFDYITININKKVNKEKIYGIIEHEITHAYEDLKLHISKKDTLLAKTIRNKYELLAHDNSENFMNKIKDILYLLDDSEQKAYIAQFDGILGDNMYDNVQQAFDAIYSSKLYKQIKEFKFTIEDTKLYSDICNCYREIYDVKYTDNKIMKKLIKDWNHFWNKFTNHVYQCVCDHVKTYVKRIHPDLNADDTNMDAYIGKSIFIENKNNLKNSIL